MLTAYLENKHFVCANLCMTLTVFYSFNLDILVVTGCAGVRHGPGSDLNRMPLFVPKFKPEVSDSTVQNAVAKECPVIRRGLATGVRLTEVQ